MNDCLNTKITSNVIYCVKNIKITNYTKKYINQLKIIKLMFTN